MTERTFNICMMCGGEVEDGAHHETERCQRATARLVLSIADGGECPYCQNPRGRGFTALKKCKRKHHAEKLAYCRRLLTEPGKRS